MRKIIPAFALLLIAPFALAQTTRTYSYDALGRLTKVTPGTGTPVCYTYDQVDNRTNVSASAGCTVGGGGGGTPGAHPPVAVSDYFAVPVWFQPWTEDFDVLGNDTDADLPGDTLTITSVTGVGSGQITIVNGGTVLRWTGTSKFSKHLTYTIKDQANQTSTAFLDIDFFDCPNGDC